MATVEAMTNPNPNTSLLNTGQSLGDGIDLPEPPFWTVPFFSLWIALASLSITSLILFRIVNTKWFVKAALRALRLGGPIPSHVAFIMDGNRRWARKGGLQPHEGHPHGGNKLIEMLQWCLEANVETVTAYAFSIENFKRSRVEVQELLDLALRKFRDFADRSSVFHNLRVRVRVMGDLSLIPDDLRNAMTRVMVETMHYTDGPTLNICFAYTSRYDIASAVQEVSELCRDGKLPTEDLSESVLADHLSSGSAKGAAPNTPYPQLLVRTSGETRLSDFLLWEASDAVLSFYPALWPDLNAWDFVKILLDYQSQVALRKRSSLHHAKRKFSS